MSASARLLSLRIQGFKSFAARTHVEFGPGISAVVGPNGAGKSNLADALRWVFGEQGRALRSRRAEDVIFAGSERRSALGMAEATLSLDNEDGLLPIDYRVLELGRRLYRSGENEYLLNRQRIRLRDLIDLLDAANLADNAFLFIGQGMVDQALSLRPEERRPLFEEVAGVRRHERRRRKAEDELAEAEGNLTRVEDILAELRPQARRLGAMAEQQATRELAVEELVAAVLGVAHARWHEAVARAAVAGRELAGARLDVDRALEGLARADRSIGEIRARLAERGAAERTQRVAHDEALAALTATRIAAAQMATELAAVRRDEVRAIGERDAAEAARGTRQRELAGPVPAVDEALEAAVRAADAALAEAVDELASLRSAQAREDEELRATRRARAARDAEVDAARRRVAQSTADAEREGRRAAELEVDAAERGAVAADARAESERGAVAVETAAEAARTTAAELAGQEAQLRAAVGEREEHRARLAATAGQLAALERRRTEEEERGIARAARRRGGRRLDDGLVVDPELRPLVETALGEATRGYVVDDEAVAALGDQRGVLVLGAAREASTSTGRGAAAASITDLAADPRASVLRERLAAAGGGLLADAIRHDPTGAARRLLALAVWMPTAAEALTLRPLLPPGAIVVARDATAVVGPLTVTLGGGEGLLERRAAEDRLRADVEAMRAEEAAFDARWAAARDGVAATRARLDALRREEAAADQDRRRAIERERAAGREAEAAAREAAWSAAQAERLASEAARARASLEGFDLAEAADRTTPPSPDDESDGGARATWEARAAQLRRRRDELASELGEQERGRREAERHRAAVEAALGAAVERITRAAAELERLAERRVALEADSSRTSADIEVAQQAESAARADLAAIAASEEADRGRMADAERAATHERQQLRAAEDRSRRAEATDLQARLELDAVREQVLVELAGLGDRGLAGLREVGPAGVERAAVQTPAASEADGADEQANTDDIDESAALEAALAAAAAEWAVTPPPAERPSPGRLAWLRRRYHELGAANPFAVREYEEVRTRLDALESQAADLRAAIGRIRALIAELNTLIADQFRSTFRALEVAFDRRFQQLFGGGFARLTLTAPEDLAATGVEIVARPPGKKAQPLAMLSGGERALTAVALLFAMLEVRPVPFCVLDEVDAALDEANVGRFAEALRRLAERTQFIVITHNRGTIEAADALYGVTVGEDSVSRVISLRLEEAAELAAAASPAPEREPPLVTA